MKNRTNVKWRMPPINKEPNWVPLPMSHSLQKELEQIESDLRNPDNKNLLDQYEELRLSLLNQFHSQNNHQSDNHNDKT